MENHTIAENIIGAKSKTLGGHLDVNATSLEEVGQSNDSTGNHIDTNHQNESEDKLISEDPKEENPENSKFDEDELLRDEDEVDKGKHINCVSSSETLAADGAISVNDRLSNSTCDTLDAEDFHSATEQTDVTTGNDDRLLFNDETVASTSRVSDSDLAKITAVDRAANISQVSDVNTNTETAECSKAVMETGVENPRNITDDSLYEATARNQLPEATLTTEKPTYLEVEQPMDVDSDNSGSTTVSSKDVSNDNVTTINRCEANERLRSTNGELKESSASRVREKGSSELDNTSYEISKESEGNNGREPKSTGDVTSKEFETVPDVGKTADNSCKCTRTETESTCNDPSKDMGSTGENVSEGVRSIGDDVSTDVAEDNQKERRTEVLHIDQNEDDAEIVLDTGEKDPFGQENEVGTGDVEPTPSNDKETVETEPMDVDQSVDLDENETSQHTNSKSTTIKDLPDSGKTAEEVGDENCIIPDSVVNDEAAAKNGLDVSKQIIRKFDITPVRLEKLMDPTKLANSKVQSTELDRSAGVGVRPQRRAAIKAESQIKEIVAQNDGEPEVEEPEQSAVCCRCSRLRLCKYIPSLAKFACKEYCYAIVLEKKTSTPATAIKMVSTTLKVHQPQQPQPKVPPVAPSVHFLRKCAHCGLRNIVEEKSVSWEAMDFCNEDCLNRYQTKNGSYCAYCKNLVQHTSMGKYAVRFGLEARQFCSGGCLEEFKKGLKSCGYCQKDITKLSTVLHVASGETKQMKDFCSVSCKDNYDCMSQNRPLPVTEEECTVCTIKKSVEFQVVVDGKRHPLCSDVCFSAFNFANNISDTDQCNICKKYYEENSPESYFVYHDNASFTFCSKVCMNVFILFKRKIVPCNWCKVKKYNFDMIRKTVLDGNGIHMCSINCLTLFQVSMNASTTRKIKCDLCSTVSHAQYHLTMSDATIRNFCSYNCVMIFQAQYSKAPLTVQEHGKTNVVSVPVPLERFRLLCHHLSTDDGITAGSALEYRRRKGAPTRVVTTQTGTKVINANEIQRTTAVAKSNVSVANGLLPQITSTAGTLKVASPLTVVTTTSTSLSPVISTTSSVQVQTQTKYIQQIIVKPPEPKEMANKTTQCRPITVTKGVSCKPKLSLSEAETQTDEYLKYPAVIPIPVPIYVPTPMHMFTTPFPVPVPFPLPVPVPIFIPTSQKTFKGVVGHIKEILDKTPANPYEADLLLMAKMVAGEEKPEEEVTKNDSGEDDDTHFADAAADLSDETFPDSEPPATTNFSDEVLQALKMATEQLSNSPTVDLEAELTSNTITPQTQVEENTVAPAVDVPEPPPERPRTRKRAQKQQASETPVRKRGRQAQQQQQQQQTTPPTDVESLPTTNSHNTPQRSTDVVASPVAESDRPDASMCLKYTIGVRGWKQWVIQKNEQLEQAAAAANKKAKTFNTNILKLTTDELNYLLCMFVKEVRKPNGMEYAPDTIYYLCLSIQQYLFENGRIDNIFTDTFYEQFTDALDEVAKKFSEVNDTTQFVLTRVEEEHLWESKQLGAHSPHVLLATLMFFNTKYFNLATLEEHMQLSFSHIMKHWKRNPNAPPGKPGSPAPNRNVVLRFYPPKAALDAPNSRKKTVYEQHENEVNPLRCPVKLYEFYLSKCPESVKQRNDVFYLQPERSCVPDSPVWYSTMPLQKELLMKMLHRIRMVKERYSSPYEWQLNMKERVLVMMRMRSD